MKYTHLYQVNFRIKGSTLFTKKNHFGINWTDY